MDLTKVTLAVRPRQPWEAVDLGIRMARRWFWPLLRVWVVLTLPFWLLLHLVPKDYLWVAPLLLWWSKPVWERALLHILSQVVFGTLPSTGATLRAFPRLIRPQLIASLTWRRFSPFRSMDLPVTQLEGLNGRRRSDRLALLHQQDAGPAGWLTVMGVHLEGVLTFAVFLLGWALLPSTIDINLSRDFFENQPFWFLAVQNLVSYIAISLVAPFYVASGFALYLNRRVRLEGWDVELAFKQMLQRRVPRQPGSVPGPAGNAKQSARVASGVLPCLVAGFLAASALLTPPPALADEPPAEAQQPLTPQTAKQAIEEVLQDEAFNQTRTLKLPKLEMNSDFDFSFPEFSVPWVAPLLEALLWAVVLLLLVIILLRYGHWLREFGLGRKPPPMVRRPDTLFGLDLRPESLPEDVAAAVRSLWHQGEERAALALLYRASLIELMDAELDIRPGYTEEDCLRVARRFCKSKTVDYFAKVTRHWQLVAYSHRSPPAEQVEELCLQWVDIWQPRAAEVAAHG